MKIEKMAIHHLPDVTILATQLGYPNDVLEITKRFTSISMSNNYGLFIALSNNGDVMGFLQINEEPESLLLGRRADISALVVHEKYRNLKVGAALVKHAEDWALRKGLLLIRVKSNINRNGAHRFYQREGYELLKTSHIFVKSIDLN